MRKTYIDWYILTPVILIIVIGIIMVLSASSPTTVTGSSKDAFFYFKRQLMWTGLGFTGMIIAASYNYQKLKKYIPVAVLVSFILLLVVFGFQPIKGARSWIKIGGFQFQPSEFVKLSLVVILSGIMSVKKSKMHSFKEGFLPCSLLVGSVCILIGLEDLGSALVIAITSFIMLYIGGINKKHLSVLFLAGTALASLAVVMAPYRIARFLAFLNPYKDPTGSGYQIIQSLYAIGSGGLLGVGLGQSMQKFGHIPEQHTDFIFSIIAEELGFIGGTLIISLFFLLALRGYYVATKAPDPFGSYIASGITTLIVVEAVINIAVVTSCMPVTGITLPLISYGGSSLVFKLAGIGLLLNISKAVHKKASETGSKLKKNTLEQGWANER